MFAFAPCPCDDVSLYKLSVCVMTGVNSSSDIFEYHYLRYLCDRMTAAKKDQNQKEKEPERKGTAAVGAAGKYRLCQ